MDAITATIICKIATGLGLNTLSLVAAIVLTYLVCRIKHEGAYGVVGIAVVAIIFPLVGACLIITVNASMNVLWQTYLVFTMPFILAWLWAWVKIEEHFCGDDVIYDDTMR